MGDDMNTIKGLKLELRKSVQKTLQSLSEAELAKQSSKIHEQLYSLKEYQNARTVSIYLSMPNGEVSTKDIVKHALQSGKTVFVPYLYHDQSLEPPRSTMDMVSLHSQADYEAFKPDKWGIPVPDTTSISGRLRCLRTGSEDTTSNKGARSKLDLIVVPGVAFDKDCRRLGHGRGYYDFFLSRYQSNNNSLGSQATMPFLVGLALQEQVLSPESKLPVTPTDWQLDVLISGDGSIYPRPPDP